MYPPLILKRLAAEHQRDRLEEAAFERATSAWPSHWSATAAPGGTREPARFEERVAPARSAQADGSHEQVQLLERPACGEVVAGEHHQPVDPVYALFRRAVCDADPDAWAHLAVTFRGLVLATVRQQAGSFRITSDDDWVYRSLERFWHAVTPARFDEFPDGPSLARYLKLCAASAYLDAVRAQRRHATLDLDQVDPAALSGADLEAELLDQQAGRELWTTILGLLKDDTERTLAYLSFVRGMTPREIRAADPGRFGSVEQIYRAKRRILERLQRHLPAAYSSVRPRAR